MDYEELEGEEYEEIDDFEEDELDYMDVDDEGEEVFDYEKGLNSIYSKIKDNNPSKPAVPKSKEDIETQKSLFLARNNSIKNSMLKSSSPNIFVGKKRNKGLLGAEDNSKKNQNNKANLQKNMNNNLNKKKVNFSLSTNKVNSKEIKPIYFYLINKIYLRTFFYF